MLVVGAGGVRLDASEGGALVCKKRYASEAMSMSDQDDWEFAGPDDQIGDPRRGGVFAERCYRRRPR